MDKKEYTSKLLKTLGEVDDKFIVEALEDFKEKPSGRAKVSSIARYKPVIISLVAAALFLIVLGPVRSIFFRSGSSSSSAPKRNEQQTSEAMAQVDGALSDETSAGVDDRYLGTNGRVYNYSSEEEIVDEMAPEAPAGAEAAVDITTAIAEAASLEELAAVTGTDINVPEQAGESVSRRYFAYELGISEVQYFDADGNLILTIRKAPSEYEDISGLNVCYSVVYKVDVDGLENVRLFGDSREFSAASWNLDGCTYFVNGEPMSSDEMISLIGSIS